MRKVGKEEKSNLAILEIADDKVRGREGGKGPSPRSTERDCCKEKKEGGVKPIEKEEEEEEGDGGGGGGGDLPPMPFRTGFDHSGWVLMSKLTSHKRNTRKSNIFFILSVKRWGISPRLWCMMKWERSVRREEGGKGKGKGRLERYGREGRIGQSQEEEEEDGEAIGKEEEEGGCRRRPHSEMAAEALKMPD